MTKREINRSRDRRNFAADHLPAISIQFNHELTGLQIVGPESGAQWLQVSFPRLAFGDNRQLIRTDQQLTDATDLLFQLAGAVCEIDSAVNQIRLTRIDPVVHVPFVLGDVIAAHRGCKHPKIHKLTKEFDQESLRFMGTERKCRMYSPELKIGERRAEYTRIEWELHTRAIRKDFGRVLYLHTIRLSEIYSVFRMLCLGFVGSAIPKVGSVYEFLALGVVSGWNRGGIPSLDLYLQTCTSKEGRARVKRNVAACIPRFSSIDWRLILPEKYTDFLERQIPS